jgi:pilus assembly protein FimV
MILMHRTLLSLAVGSLFFGPAISNAEVNFGRVNNATVLGASLDFLVTLSGDNSTMVAECFQTEVYAGTDKIAQEFVQTSIVATNPQSIALKIMTTSRIQEPVVNIKVTYICGAPVTRSFTALVDPPEINLPRSTEEISSNKTTQVAQDLSPNEVLSLKAPDLDNRRAAQFNESKPTERTSFSENNRNKQPKRNRDAEISDSTSAKSERGMRLEAGTRLQTQEEGSVSRSTKNPTRQKSHDVVARDSAPVRAVGGRLSLDPEAPAQQPGQTTATAAALPIVRLPLTWDGVANSRGGSPAASASGVDALLAEEKAKIGSLELALGQLRQENRTARLELAKTRAQLAQNSTSASNSLGLYLLGLLCVLLAGLAAFLAWALRRRHRDQEETKETAWWKSMETEGNSEASLPASSAPAIAAGPLIMSKVVPSSIPPRVAQDPTPRVLTQSQSQNFAAKYASSAQRNDTLFDANHHYKHVSVEELIDLEQQADFFIVLGQDEAAVELLLDHIQGTGETSPMPYLKLLDIYRRMDDPKGYELVRTKFNQSFNAYAPDWESEPSSSASLDAYPEIVESIQNKWNSPQETMGYLESLLFSQGGSTGTFDLEAYGELLLLYSIARDFSDESDPEQPVNLLPTPPTSSMPSESVQLAHSLPLSPSQPSHLVTRLVSSPVSVAPPELTDKKKTDIPLDLDLGIDFDLSEFPSKKESQEYKP